MQTTEILAERMKKRRSALGLTTADLGEMTGLSAATIRRYENGTFKTIKLAIVESIAAALKVSPQWLVGKSDNMHNVTRTSDDLRNTLKRLIWNVEISTDLEYDGHTMNEKQKAAVSAALNVLIKSLDILT